MQKRNATAAVIGAGDFIGGEIAKKFAAEGFTVFAGRRNGDKLAPLVKDIEAAGGEIHARSLDADVVSGADHGHGCVSLLQGCSPRLDPSSAKFGRLRRRGLATFATQGLRELVLEYLAG